MTARYSFYFSTKKNTFHKVLIHVSKNTVSKSINVHNRKIVDAALGLCLFQS